MIFVKLKNGQVIVTPKNQISNLSDLISKLKTTATNLNINYIVDDK
jgi:hypothetical protein